MLIDRRLPLAASRAMKRSGSLAFLVALFAVAGVMHFVQPGPFVSIVPALLPRPDLVVAVSGIAELLGAAGLVLRRTRRAAGFGLILLLVAIFPANIKMLADAARTGASPLWQAALWARLPLQLLLIWVIWSTAIKVRR